MSQTETTGSESTGAIATAAEDLGNASLDQLKQLVEDHKDDPATQQALQGLIDERMKLEAQLKESSTPAKAAKAPAKSRKGSRAPKGRAIPATESFNSDPENLARLKRVLEGDPTADDPIPAVIQSDGSYRMTANLIQLCISGYYDERRNEGGSTAKPKKTTEPIIPDPAATAAGTEDAVDGGAPDATLSEVDDAGGEEDLLGEPQAQAGPPYNPYSEDDA